MTCGPAVRPARSSRALAPGSLGCVRDGPRTKGVSPRCVLRRTLGASTLPTTHFRQADQAQRLNQFTRRHRASSGKTEREFPPTCSNLRAVPRDSDIPRKAGSTSLPAPQLSRKVHHVHSRRPLQGPSCPPLPSVFLKSALKLSEKSARSSDIGAHTAAKLFQVAFAESAKLSEDEDSASSFPKCLGKC